LRKLLAKIGPFCDVGLPPRSSAAGCRTISYSYSRMIAPDGQSRRGCVCGSVSRPGVMHSGICHRQPHAAAAVTDGKYASGGSHVEIIRVSASHLSRMLRIALLLPGEQTRAGGCSREQSRKKAGTKKERKLNQRSACRGGGAEYVAAAVRFDDLYVAKTILVTLPVRSCSRSCWIPS